MDLVEASARQFDTPHRHPWEVARLAIVRRLIEEHGGLKSGDVVLDVGCGDSYVAEQLALAYPGVRFLAVDTAFTDDLIARWRARMPVATVSLFASLDDVPPPDRPAALVLLMDVIEHVPDDVAMLREVGARPYVTTDTRFLITVPAYQRLFCSHDRVLGHYRRYTAGLLRARAAAAGLRVRASGYLFASLLPVRVLQVLRERMRKTAPTATGLTTWQGGEGAGRTLAIVLEADARVALLLRRFGITLPGLSAFAICSKSA
jgi:hypothetical protein